MVHPLLFFIFQGLLVFIFFILQSGGVTLDVYWLPDISPATSQSNDPNAKPIEFKSFVRQILIIKY